MPIAHAFGVPGFGVDVIGDDDVVVNSGEVKEHAQAEHATAARVIQNARMLRHMSSPTGILSP